MKRVYMDNAAGSFPKAPGVAQAVYDYLTQNGCNVGRSSYQSAADAEDEVLKARERLCALLGFDDPSHAVFSCGVTFSLNALIRGLLGPGDHCIVSGFEHNAVMRPLIATGARFSVARLGPDGRFERPEALFEPNTRLVLLTHASNVFGNVLPVEQFAPLCAARGVPLAADCAQTAGHMPVDMSRMGLDALLFAGHKGLLGPAGVGGMLIRRPLAKRLRPLVEGGTGSASDSMRTPAFMPDKFEAGTLNIPGIWGLSAALGYLLEIGVENVARREAALRARFCQSLAGLGGVRVINAPGAGHTGVASLVFTDMDQAEAAYRLESEFGVQTRCGLHCAPLAHQSMGTFPGGTVRFSFGAFTTPEEVDFAARAVKRVCGRAQ